jgi:GH25 family lysozyme M1 (1,4-beta-N-acetylmuramidase)
MIKIKRLTAMILVLAAALSCFGLPAFAAENEYSYDTRYAGFKGRGLIHDERFAGRELHYGIDVSAHQNEVDWKAVADAGCEFVFVRVGYRGYETGLIVEDKYAADNIRGALNNGLLVGVYLYSQAITLEEGIEEADFIIDFLDRYEFGPANILLPVVYDVEYPSEDGKYVGRLYDAKLSVRTRTDIAKAFMDRIDEAGYVPCFYGSRSAFNNNSKAYMTEINDSYRIWLAAYTQNKKAGYDGLYEFWQYSSFGKVPGIEGETDLDVWYLDPAAQYGWVRRDGNVRYLDAPEGPYRTGWQTIDGRTYYFTQDGNMLTGWQYLDGKNCYFGRNGIIRTGWQDIDGGRYFFGEDGDLKTGWQTMDGITYWFGTGGAMQTGWQTIEGQRYCFGADGAMLKGWCAVDGEYYCFGEDGKPLTGKQKIGKTTFRFDEDGKLIWGAVKVRPYEGGTRGPLKAILVTPWKKIQFGK